MDEQASYPAPQSFRSLSLGEKVSAVLALLLVVLSLASIAASAVLGLLAIWLLIPQTYWFGSFVGSAASIVGWMIFYGVQFRFGGMMLFRSNSILICILISSGLLSCFMSFSSRTVLPIVFGLLLVLLGSISFPLPRRLFGVGFDLVFRPGRFMEKHREAMRRVQSPRPPSGSA